MPTSPRFSLVVPARNEEKYLTRLLDSAQVAGGRYRGGRDAVEVIVADNISTDGTAEIAAAAGARVARVEKRVIAAVRNGGARIAQGETLVFLDADSALHPETFNAIEDALASPNCVGGATGVRMERMSIGIAAAYAFIVPFVWLTGMDTGAVFCRRADFVALGGYDENLRVAEDVRFLLDLRQLGKSRGQKLVRVRSAKALASTRKFDTFGDWHYLLNLGRSLYGFCLRRHKFDDLVQTYWYDDHR